MNRLTEPGRIKDYIFQRNGKFFEVYTKLCSYEDTGLEPNEICNMMAHNTALIEKLAEYEKSEQCDHDYFLGCISEDLIKVEKIEDEHKRFHYKIGTLICRRCGEVKQIEVDVYGY